MTRNLLMYFLAASIAVPAASFTTVSLFTQTAHNSLSQADHVSVGMRETESASVKPGKSHKKYKKKMGKQMKKHKRH